MLCPAGLIWEFTVSSGLDMLLALLGSERLVTIREKVPVLLLKLTVVLTMAPTRVSVFTQAPAAGALTQVYKLFAKIV